MKSFLGNFYRHFAIFSGHTGRGSWGAGGVIVILFSVLFVGKCLSHVVGIKLRLRFEFKYENEIAKVGMSCTRRRRPCKI